MPPLAFTDEEIDLLSALASALPPSARGTFLEIVGKKLGAYQHEARGPGLLHRIPPKRSTTLSGLARSLSARAGGTRVVADAGNRDEIGSVMGVLMALGTQHE